MADELPKEELLRKMLNMTTSDNDGQALVAIRKANALLAQAGWSWDKLLAGKIKIVENPFKSVPDPRKPEQVEEPRARPPKPSLAPRPGMMWIWSPFNDQWELRADPNYRAASPPPPPPRPTPRRGLGLTRSNMYANHCYCCGDYVNNNAGFIMKPRDLNPAAPDKWTIVCKDCNTNLSNINRTPAMKNTGQTTVTAPAPTLGDL